MIFPSLGSKQVATRFPTGCTNSPTGSPVLSQEQAESLGSGI